MANYYMLIIIIAFATVVINLPFGYARVKTRKFSVQWFLYIHLPIPLIFVMRRSAGIDYRAIPLFIAGAVLGQVLGGRFRSRGLSGVE